MNIPKFDKALVEAHYKNLCSLRRKPFIGTDGKEYEFRLDFVNVQGLYTDDDCRLTKHFGHFYDVHVEDGVLFNNNEMFGTLVDEEKKKIRNKIAELEEEISKLKNLL